MEEKNNALSTGWLNINLTNNIPPNIVEINVNTRAIMPSILNLNSKPVAVGIIPSNKYFPRNNVGIKNNIYKTKIIFVDFFIPLFFAKHLFVYTY